jgi:nicotinamide-nucleotide amidase
MRCYELEDSFFSPALMDQPDGLAFAINAQVLRLALAFTKQQKKLATAESCTGGWIAQSITALAGSSIWFDRGFITYSNKAKVDMLEVATETLVAYGAVSAQTAMEMAIGALNRSDADMAVAVTGIAGPEGGSAEKPVGTVFIAWAVKSGENKVEQFLFDGDRNDVRIKTVFAALKGMEYFL